MMSPSAAATALLTNRNPAAIDGFLGGHGVDLDRLRDLAEMLAVAEGLSLTIHRVIEDGDWAMVHATQTGLASGPLVVFDVMRVVEGRIVAHHDAAAAMAPPNPSGRTQVDGPVAVGDPGLTDTSRALVRDFVESILIGARYDELPRFIAGDDYAQHNSQIADGLSGLGAALDALAAQGLAMVYTTLHQVVAQGHFVFTRSTGRLGDTPMAYFDLFRVDHGKIVEHWDIMQPIPADRLRFGSAPQRA